MSKTRNERRLRRSRAIGSAVFTVCILLALDYEDSGAGIVGLEWWLSTYAACLRWPTPEGKDPGNAFEMGVDIREWLDGGLPETISLMPQGVQLDTLSSGSVSLGGEGRSPESPASLRKKEGIRVFWRRCRITCVRRTCRKTCGGLGSSGRASRCCS